MMNGFDVLEWLRAHPAFSELPALVLSSSAHEEDVKRSRSLGAKDYRVKPGDLNQLTQLARELANQCVRSNPVA